METGGKAGEDRVGQLKEEARLLKMNMNLPEFLQVGADTPARTAAICIVQAAKKMDDPSQQDKESNDQ